jgi:hypothetical protein
MEGVFFRRGKDPLSKYLFLLKEHRRPGYGNTIGATVGAEPERPSPGMGLMHGLLNSCFLLLGALSVLNFFSGSHNRDLWLAGGILLILCGIYQGFIAVKMIFITGNKQQEGPRNLATDPLPVCSYSINKAK